MGISRNFCIKIYCWNSHFWPFQGDIFFIFSFLRLKWIFIRFSQDCEQKQVGLLQKNKGEKRKKKRKRGAFGGDALSLSSHFLSLLPSGWSLNPQSLQVFSIWASIIFIKLFSFVVKIGFFFFLFWCFLDLSLSI